jgi:zinc/manganese transport system substrate-binding protein
MTGRLLPLLLVALASLAVAVSGCGAQLASARPGQVLAVAAENQYGNVIAQVGGPYVAVASVLDNPNTDPHTFEASTRVAETVSQAALVVQNGVGYDTFMNRIEAATPSAGRRVIDVQRLLRVAPGAANPHLWYRPGTMAAVADAVSRELSARLPEHAAAFRSRAARFKRSLAPWRRALSDFRRRYGGVRVAVTEPVADALLTSAGARIATPFSFQADIMNGVDPAPQAVTQAEGLLTGGRVRALVYNAQVTDSITQTLLARARAHHVPVVGVYETMPPGYDYQRWMLAEVRALRRAVARGASTPDLVGTT